MRSCCRWPCWRRWSLPSDPARIHLHAMVEAHDRFMNSSTDELAAVYWDLVLKHRQALVDLGALEQIFFPLRPIISDEFGELSKIVEQSMSRALTPPRTARTGPSWQLPPPPRLAQDRPQGTSQGTTARSGPAGRSGRRKTKALSRRPATPARVDTGQRKQRKPRPDRDRGRRILLRARPPVR